MRSVSSRPEAVPTTLIGPTAPAPIIAKLSKFLPKSPKDMNRLQRRLSTAGLHGAGPLAAYLIGEVALAAIAFVIPLSLLGWRRGTLFAVQAAVVGYMIPSFVLSYYVN